MGDAKQWRRIKNPDTSRKYREEMIDLATTYCGIYPCCNCGHPVIKGYRCTTCGSPNPDNPKGRQEPSND